MDIKQYQSVTQKIALNAIESAHIMEASSVIQKQIQPTLRVAKNLAKMQEYAEKYQMHIPNFDNLNLDNGTLDKELQPQQPLTININLQQD